VSDTPHSIADLLASGVVLEWHEAVAIMQGLCLAINASPDSTTEAKLTLDQVFVDPGGTIRLGVRPGPASALPQLKKVLLEMLPSSEYAQAKALNREALDTLDYQIET